MEPVQDGTDGWWNADEYFENVLLLDRYIFGFETNEYIEYQHGCQGIAAVRLGLPGLPLGYAKKCFKRFDSALKYAQSLPAVRGKRSES